MTYYEEWGRNMTDFCEQSGFGFLASPSDRYLEFRFLQAPPLARLNPSEHPDQLRLSWSATNFVLSCDLLPLQRFQFRVSALQHKVWCWMELKVCFLCNLYQYHVTFFQQGFFFLFFLFCFALWVWVGFNFLLGLSVVLVHRSSPVLVHRSSAVLELVLSSFST